MPETTANTTMAEVLARWNMAGAEGAAREVLPCCGSLAWAEGLAARRPVTDVPELLRISDSVWQGLSEDDWREAFSSHPRIGQGHATGATRESLVWSSEEQRAAAGDLSAEAALVEANGAYEARFGRTFIVCATGKSAAEILAIFEARMKNDARAEMLEAAEQQRQITQLRLRRWLGVD